MSKDGLQLIKTDFIPNYKTKDKKHGKIIMITKNSKGEKGFKIIDKPIIEYYYNKPEAPVEKVRSMKIDQVNKRKCYYADLYEDIVKVLNDEDINTYYAQAQTCSNNRDKNSMLKKLHLDFRIHGTDVNIEDHYIAKFLEQHPAIDNNYQLTKLFYDIETDISQIVGFPNPDEALCPVNIISSCFKEEDTLYLYAFALHYTEKENPSYVNFMNNVKENVVPIKEELEKKANCKIKIIIKRFNNEINLIKSFFDLINDKKPDYVMGWNTHKFDFPYLYNRTKILLLTSNDPRTVEDIMCPTEMPYKQVKYYVDNDKVDPTDNNSTVNVTSYSVHIDQENLYASLRKAKGKLESYGLDAISELELGEHKEELTTSMKTQFLDDYNNFFKYSLNDSLLLYLLEEKGHDIEMLNAVATITKTRVEQCLKKTICLRNLADSFYKEGGRVLSNNRSALEHKDGKPRGAFVADPKLIDYIGKILFKGATKSKYILEECSDLDLASLYPSIIRFLNLAPETFIKRWIINEFDEDSMTYVNKADVFIDEWVSEDYVSVGNKYLNLPTAEDILNEII